jgi:hypothetical protein
MAEYVKFRLATAKVGASMALLALIAGVAEKARAATSPTAKPAASGGIFLKLSGIGTTIASDFGKVEKKLFKLDSAISSLDKKWLKLSSTLSKSYYSAHKANATFLKITDAGTQYLKVTDANAKFLKADGTAVNAQKLGNLSPNQFFQGNGNVVSGVLGNLTQQSQQLLSLPGGIIVVDISQTPGAGPTLTIHNGTAGAGVAEYNGQTRAIAPSGDTVLPAVQDQNEVRVQIFPSAGFNNVVSILIGLTPNPTNNQQVEAVAQAFTGGV